LTTVVVVQARTGSSRLPGKVLADVGGRPMLALQLARLRRVECDATIVATSDRSRDDPVEQLALDADALVVRGPEDDVLARFALVVDRYHPEVVVRVTADCPLVDPEVVDAVVRLHRETEADYASNVHPRSFPRGLDVEVVSTPVLTTAALEASRDDEREHVTPFVVRHPERFRLANLDSGGDHARHHWTVDVPEDLDRVRRIVARGVDPERAGWRDFLELDRQDVGDRRELGMHLRPLPSPRPGSNPWVKSWIVERAGIPVGRASVSVRGAEGIVDIDCPGFEADAARAVDAHLEQDVQVTRWRPR
jgi:spore coat polysaccharide biosynthesis protein SpsF